MKQKKQKKQNIGIGILFILLVAFVILISFTAKVFEIYTKTSFDGRNRFNISHLGDRGWEVISLYPEDRSITILQTDTKDQKKFNTLRIPSDLVTSSGEDLDEENVKGVLNSLLTEANANIFDSVKINLFLNSVPSKSISQVSIEVGDGRVYEKISTALSNDSFLSEKLTIELVNSTGERGIGSNVARFITNLGGNVILVNTGSKVESTSHIYSLREDFETVKKIQKLLRIDISNTSQPTLSDVKIVIGRDLIERFR